MPKLWGMTTVFFKCTVLLVQKKANSSGKFLNTVQSEEGEFTRLSVSLSCALQMGALERPGDCFGIQAPRGTCLCSNSFNLNVKM